MFTGRIVWWDVCFQQGFPSGSVIKNLVANTGDAGSIAGSRRSPGGEDMANHCSVVAWRIPWTEESGRL